MQLVAQSYPVPKAGGQVWFKLVADGGTPVSLTSVTSSDSAISSSIVTDLPNMAFGVTFPANSTSSTKTYVVNGTYVENNKSWNGVWEIDQNGNTNILSATSRYIRPFINRMYLYFDTNLNTSNLSAYITTIGDGPDYSAPHFTSVAEFIAAYQNNALNSGQWVYVDGFGYNNSTNNTYYSYNTTSQKVTKLTFSATGAGAAGTSANPVISFSSVYDAGFATFSSRPDASTFNTMGFKVPSSGVTSTGVSISTDAFLFRKNTSTWNFTDQDLQGNPVPRPYVEAFDIPQSATINNVSGNSYYITRNYGTATTRVRHRIFGIKDSNDTYSAEVDNLQVPADSVVISETTFSKDYTSGSDNFIVGTFANFTFSGDYFSITFPDGQPAWITGWSFNNPSGSNIGLTLTCTQNTTGDIRSCNAVLNWLDKTTNIVLRQKSDAVGTITAQYNPANLKAKSGTYLDPLTVTNITSLNVSNSNTSKFTTSIVEQSGTKYLQIVALTANLCQSAAITDTAVITGIDGNGDTITLNVPISQSIEFADYNFTPYTQSGQYAEIDPTGETVDFTFYNEQCTGTNFYHLTGINEVWYTIISGGTSQTYNLNYTTAFVNGLLHCYVVFPANAGTRIPASGYTSLLFDVADDFVPGPINQASSSFDFYQEQAPAGSISITTSDPLWYNATLYSDSQSSAVNNVINFTSSNIDTSTLSYSFTTTNIVNASAFVGTDRIGVELTPNTTNNERSTVLTISATDYRSNTVSDTITLRQVPNNEGIKLYVTSPTGTSSGSPYIIQGNTMTIDFDAVNLGSFTVTGTMASYVTNASFTNTSGNHYQAALTFSANTGTTVRNGSLYINGVNTVSGSPLNANWTSMPVTVRQPVADGSITTDINAIVVPANSDYDHRDVKVTSSGISGAIVPSVSGDVSGTFSWYTHNNESYLIFTPANNSTQNTLTGTITLTGTDYNGNTVTTSYSVTQKPYNPKIEYLASALGFYRILNTESSRSINIVCKAITNINRVDIEDSSQSAGSFTSYYVSSSLTKVDSEHYTFVVNTRNNDTHTQSSWATLEADISGTEFGKNPWVDAYLVESIFPAWYISKCGIPGVLTLSPSSRTVDGTLGSTSFTINKDQYLTGNISASHTGNMDVTTFTYDNSSVGVGYGENTGLVDKTELITVSGIDYQGLEITSTSTLTQRVVTYLDFIETAKTIGQSDTTVTFRIGDKNVSNLQFSSSGNVGILNSSFTSTAEGHLLTLTVSTNNSRAYKTSTLTVSAENHYGSTIQTTATLTQVGLNGLITVDPSSRIITKTASTFVINVSTDGVPTSSLSASTSGDIVFNGTQWNNDKTQLTVSYATNIGSSDLTGTITISGTDYKGDSVSATCSITQVTEDSSLTISPSQLIVEQDTSATFTITTQYATLGNVSFSGASSYVTSYNVQGNTLTLVLNEVTTAEEKVVYVTVSGYDLGGSAISDTATLKLWGIDGYFTLTPANGWNVSKDSGYVTYSLSSSGIDSNTITKTVDQSWATVASNSRINYNAYSGVPTDWDSGRDCEFTVTGTDYKGNTITATRTLTQYALDAEMTIYPTTASIEYNEYVDVDVTLIGPAPIPELVFDTTGYTYTWLNQWGTGTTRNNTVRIVPPTNLAYVSRTLSVSFKSVPLYTSGSTIWRYLTITQAGKPASIVLTPSTSTVNKNSGSITYSIAVDGVEYSSLGKSTSGGMITSSSFNSEKTQLTVNYSANTNVANRTATVSVYSDSLGSRVTGTASITQTGVDPELTAYDLAINYLQTSSTNFIGTKGVGNLSVQFVGDVTIDNYYFTSTSGGYNLVIETPVNQTTTTYTSVATVTGTVTEGQYEGETRTVTFNVIKYGIESVSVLPSSRTLDYGVNTTTYTVTSSNVSNLQVSLSGDTSFISNQSLSNGTLTITTTDYSAKVAKTANITVSGTGFTGTVSDTVTLTKYGPAGTISVSSDSLSFPKSAYTKTVTITAEGILANTLTPSYTGTISLSALSISGSTLTISANTNTTSGDLTGVITITGTDYKGNTITQTINVTQKAYDSLLQLDPAIRTVDKNSGSTTYTITTDSVDTATLAASYSGSSVTNATISGSTLTVTYRASTIVADTNNTITVSATDDYGSQISASVTLVQTGVDPTISASDIAISNTQSTATAFVATNGVGSLTVSFTGDVTISNYSIEATTGGYNIILTTPDNLTTTIYRGTANVSGTVTEGQYQGETRSTTFGITKYGIEGNVDVSPATKTIRKAGDTIEFDVTLENMNVVTVTASTGTFNGDKSKLTVVVGANSSNVDRTINVTVSGTDTNGNTKSDTAVITQYGVDPYLSISPSSRSVASDTSVITYSVSAYKVTGLTVNISGTVTVTNYDLNNGTLTITTADNTDQFQQMSVITITGTDELGESTSATATLIKAGIGGGIIVNGEYVIPSNAGKLVIDYTLEDMDENSIIATSDGDINFTELYIIRSDKAVILSYGVNNTSENKNGRIVLSGIGEDELMKTAIINVVQLSSDYTLVINPREYDVAYTSGSKTFDVTTTGVTSEELTYSGSMDITSCTYSSGTITAVYAANEDDVIKYLYLTITGLSSNGYSVSASSVLRQAKDNTGGAYVFSLSPGGQTVKNIEASATIVTYTIQSLLFTDEVPYDVTGFILSGRWGSRPTVERDDFGYPAVKVPLNTHSETRSVRVCFTQDYSGYTLNAQINQAAGVEPDVNPIWKEYKNSVNANTFIEYHINLDGKIIYSGKAYKYPDATKITWSINDTVSNYLGNGIEFVEGIHQIPDYSKDFYMETNTGEKYLETFYNSWAYEDADYIISDPIDNRVDQRQWLPVSFLTTNYDMINVGGRTYAALKENDGWTVMTKLSNYVIDCNAGIVVTGEDGSKRNYKIASGDFVLYYSNAYGGWDALLCTGTAKKTDNVEHLNYRRKSADQSQFSKVNYQNNITPTWSLNTGITIDGQKMYHLLESTMVYLHNLETDEIIPVVITNSQCEYLTYTNNGKKPYFYNITVEESNQKMRK